MVNVSQVNVSIPMLCVFLAVAIGATWTVTTFASGDGQDIKDVEEWKKVATENTTNLKIVAESLKTLSETVKELSVNQRSDHDELIELKTRVEMEILNNPGG